MSKLVLSYLFKTNLTELRSAIIEDNTDKICRILDIEHEDLSKYIDGSGNTPLLLAVKYASPLTVRLLLDQGAEPDQRNRITCQTPLGLIASKIYEDYHSHEAQQSLEMAKILLDHHAYVDKPSLHIYRDENNKEYVRKETPLMISVRRRNLPLTKLLIERKANINYIERHSQIRPIHHAITNGDETMFDFLANAGAFNCSIITSGNNSLLHWFCFTKENDQQTNVLKKLINKGCDINALNSEQRTPLMIAAKTNMPETCRILLKNGANIDKHDSKGNQAIDLSIPGSECSQLLLQQFNLTTLVKPTEKVIWRKRLDSVQRCTSPLNTIINDERRNGQCYSLKCSDDQENHPNQRREGEEYEKTHEHVWEKFLQATPQRRVLNHLRKLRPHSIEVIV